MREIEKKITLPEILWRGVIQFTILNLMGVLVVLIPISMLALGMAGAASVDAPFWLMPLPLIVCGGLCYVAYLVYRKINRFPISWNLALIFITFCFQFAVLNWRTQ
ncbi:hypothetical protein [Terasakiella sp. SH-1]|uniref:hypothetical protein n=1 Tax=Terasakiella sp. SH-1 TaxID=2560057 RepID=UPI0010737B27|nr:hypothetical protein [Terasakiella sp. SH-1]